MLYFLTSYIHSEVVSCVGWMTADDVFSVGEDHVIYKYNVVQNEVIKIAELPPELFPLDMHWLPKGASGGAGTGGTKRTLGSDLFVLGTSDGKFCFVNKTGRVEKVIDAHRGATICVRWSPDGSQFATGGEDGQVRIWARSGMLRSNLVQSATPVFCVCWSAENDSILYCSGKHLIIKPLSPNAKQNGWKAHDNVILKCDWNIVNGLIISGGEDCRYKVWDTVGRQLFVSQAYEYPITAISWAPDGSNFAVGSYNTLRLCDSAGWCHSTEKPKYGSIYGLSWSGDSTQLVCGCGTGRVGIGHIIERRIDWRHLEFILSDSKVISVNNCEEEGLKDKIELKDRLVKMSVGFGYLLVLTSSQGLIYNCKSFGHPAMFDLRDMSMTLIVQAEKYFLLSDGINVSIYSYEGRLVATPKLNSSKPDSININTISLSSDTIAIRDSTDTKSITFLDINGKPIGDGKPIPHSYEVIQIALDQTGSQNERKLAFADKFQDLFIMLVRSNSQRTMNQRIKKLCTSVGSFRWNDKNSMLAGIADGKLNIWLYPNVVFIEHNLVQRTTYHLDSSDFGKNPSISDFLSSNITIRKSTGALMQCSIPIYYELCLDLLAANRADEAFQLCQYISDDTIYALIAVISLHNHDFDSAENAFAQLSEMEMVYCLQQLRTIPTKEERDAELALLAGGNIHEAEGHYLQGNKPLHAIMLHINEHNWDRAIDLSQRYPQYLDIIVGYRQKYLQDYAGGKKETNPKYLQAMKNIDVDWDKIDAKLKKELGETNNYNMNYRREQSGSKISSNKRDDEHTIPPPSRQCMLSERQDFVNNPALMFDDLPQPFRRINKILESILDDVWSQTQQREKQRLYDLSKYAPVQHKSSTDIKVDFPVFTVGSAYNGIQLDEIITNTRLDNTMSLIDHMEVSKYGSEEEEIYFISVIDQQGNNEYWLDIYKVPKEQWKNEIKTQEESLNSVKENLSEQQSTMSLSEQTEDIKQGKTLVRGQFTRPILLFKVKAPKFGNGTNNFPQLMKATDNQLNIGQGTSNHLYTQQIIDTKSKLVQELGTGIDQQTLTNLDVDGLTTPISPNVLFLSAYPNDNSSDTRPLTIWPFSSRITSIGYDTNLQRLAVGLQTGVVCVIDKTHGNQIPLIKSISSEPIKQINVISTPDETSLFAVLSSDGKVHHIKYRAMIDDEENFDPHDTICLPKAQSKDASKITRTIYFDNQSNLFLTINEKNRLYINDSLECKQLCEIVLPNNGNVDNNDYKIFLVDNARYLIIGDFNDENQSSVVQTTIDSSPLHLFRVPLEHFPSIEKYYPIKTSINNEEEHVREHQQSKTSKKRTSEIEKVSLLEERIKNMFGRRQDMAYERRERLRSRWPEISKHFNPIYDISTTTT
ncbi:unnamed protein product [Didymodactylos carnosus]|uniref:Uncharacterized protein n=1 Tax=Didymodactylos carnosus TaxID=1234261 RepID=A0A813SZ52_9BILA|nr:unnamed protein product [Didymodactylos carnosus]CAF0887700.1 unnamed protein product [Didymodactylos carnosus]CAF3585806.1 unnamed protein product [Didymodactylos carnosus]CAF3670490.1 unnamed protein product [Didymodactylos carnosus]